MYHNIRLYPFDTDENDGEETADVGEVERPLALRRSRRVAAAQKEAEKKAKAAARRGRGKRASRA